MSQADRVVRSEYIDVDALPWSTLDWQERIPGAKTKIIWRDPSGYPVTIMTRFAAGVRVPAHRHVGEESIFVLEGVVQDDFGECRAGHFGRRPAGCTHSLFIPEETLVLATMYGDVEFL